MGGGGGGARPGHGGGGRRWRRGRAEDGGTDGGDGPEPAAAPGRAQVFSTVVDTFLEKLVAAGSYQRFVSCYRCFYKLQPQLTRSIYDQFISQLQTSIKEEIQEVKNEGNLEALFNLLDKIVEEAKDREEPAWRPSGVPVQDMRAALAPFLLRHRCHLRRALQERQRRSSSLAQEVLAGRDSIAELQRQIQARQQAWQAITEQQRELIMTLQEPQ
ncbi:polyamine-modulated factor 1-like [Geothlypis trichas]